MKWFKNPFPVDSTYNVIVISCSNFILSVEKEALIVATFTCVECLHSDINLGKAI